MKDSTEVLLDELLKDYQTPEQILGENGILKQLTKRLALGVRSVHSGR
jgi:hypothetical protein